MRRRLELDFRGTDFASYHAYADVASQVLSGGRCMTPGNEGYRPLAGEDASDWSYENAKSRLMSLAHIHAAGQEQFKLLCLNNNTREGSAMQVWVTQQQRDGSITDEKTLQDQYVTEEYAKKTADEKARLAEEKLRSKRCDNNLVSSSEQGEDNNTTNSIGAGVINVSSEFLNYAQTDTTLANVSKDTVDKIREFIYAINAASNSPELELYNEYFRTLKGIEAELRNSDKPNIGCERYKKLEAGPKKMGFLDTFSYIQNNKTLKSDSGLKGVEKYAGALALLGGGIGYAGFHVLATPPLAIACFLTAGALLVLAAATLVMGESLAALAFMHSSRKASSSATPDTEISENSPGMSGP